MLSMKVSVVIPAYNEEQYIRSCLDALKVQTVPPDEIIVVDNVSTDQTAEIAKSYGVKVVPEKRKGIAWARNRGFDTALGDIIARTDADTCVHPQWIEHIRYHASRRCEAFTGPIYDKTMYLEKVPYVVESYLDLLKLIFGHRVWIGSNIVLTRDLWEKCRTAKFAYDNSVHEDFELALEVSKYVEIQYMKDVIVYTSSRRARNDPFSFFVEYQIRCFKMAAKSKKPIMAKRIQELRKTISQELLPDER